MPERPEPAPAFAGKVEERASWQAHDSTGHVDRGKAEGPRFPNLKPDAAAGDRDRVAAQEGPGAATGMAQGRVGSPLDGFLAEEGLLEEAIGQAVKRVLAWQIEQAMQAQQLTRRAMAQCMNTSRAQLDRLLDPDNTSVTLRTLHRAAAVLGRKIRLDPV